MIKKKNWARPTHNHKSTLQPTSEASNNKKKYLWIMTTIPRWYNIGIYPIWDYINHGINNTYINKSNISTITTHERVKTSFMNEMNECNEFMNND